MSARSPRLVFSTGPGGGRCRECGEEPCACDAVRELPMATQSPRVRLDRRGRRGKTVTVVSPLFLTRPVASELLRALKRRCAGGGTLRTGRAPDGRACYVIEIQGDHVAAVGSRLREAGFPTGRRPAG